MATLTVGQGQQYSTISAAVNASRNGDVVKVQAGTYTNDFVTINTKITLESVGGMAKIVGTKSIPNDKGLWITNTDVVVDGFEFSGAVGASNNAAGIRYQGGNLVVRDSYFHDNQNGILANPSSGTITILNSEFDHNGRGDGYTHNLYVGAVAKLTIKDSFFRDAVNGHEIKSRALVSEITGNRIFDEDGTANYSIDLPNGGKAVISDNVIQQGLHSGNSNIVAFGAEGSLHGGSNLSMTDNVVINDLGRGAVLLNASNSPGVFDGNAIYGKTSQLVSGSGITAKNTTQLTTEPKLDLSHPWDGSSSPSPTPTPTPTPNPTPGMKWTGFGGTDKKTGGAGDDSLNGAGGHDSIAGAAGDDTVAGGDWNDTLSGGKGDDLIIGGKGNDIVKLERGGGDDQFQGFVSHTTVGKEHDYIDLRALGVTKANFAKLVDISNGPEGAVVEVSDTSLTLLGKSASSLDISDFLLS